MNDKKIISAIIKRDEQMLAFAVQKYSKLLWKTAAPILVNAASSQEVEECVADVFIYLWQHPEKYDPQRTKLSSYLAMNAKSRAIDRYRKIVRQRELPIEETVLENIVSAGPEDLIITEAESSNSIEISTIHGKRARLAECLVGLNEKEKDLIVRRYYYEQKPKEIAAALDMPKKQIENKLYYVKQKLKRMLEE